MVGYNTMSSAYAGNSASNYAFVSYASESSAYAIKTDTWKRSHCCGAFKFGNRCTGCPG